MLTRLTAQQVRGFVNDGHLVQTGLVSGEE